MFNSENFLWRWSAKLADYVVLSCFWLLCSLPVVTIGSASIALYDSVAHCVRGPEGGAYRRFFRTFKRELGRGIIMTLMWAVICWFLNAGYQVMTQLAEGSQTWTILSIIYFCSLFIPLGVICWAVILESRFTNTLGGIHKNAFVFTFAHLPHTFAIVALLVLVLNILINFFPLLMILPGVMVYLQSFFAEKVLKKYMPEEE